MIYRQIKFEVMYDVGTAGAPEWKREAVAEMLCNPAFGVTSVKTVTDVEIALDPMKVSLLQSTGSFDMKGAEIYHAHLLIDAEGDIWQVIYANAAFMLNKGETLKQLDDIFCSTLTIIGDAITGEKLIAPENVDELMEASKGRRIQPPIVKLKKKTT